MADNKRRAIEAGETLARKVVSVGIDGAGPFKGCQVIGDEAMRHAGKDVDVAIKRVVALHVRVAGVEGFATGLPGGVAMVATLPADLTAFYLLAGRMVGSIAYLRGYDVHDDAVRSAVLVALLGASGGEVLKDFGVEVGTKGLAAAMKKVPGKIFIEINKKVGFRLITKAGEKGVINVGKIVPLIGGPIGLVMNASGMRGIAAYAKSALPPVPPDDQVSGAAAVPLPSS